MKAHHKIKHHCLRFSHAVQDAAQAITNPTAEAPQSEVVVDRPNYMLTGLRAPHVYGFPDQAKDVRIAGISDTEPRRIQRNHSLHYDQREYKPMTMQRAYRRL